jgi:hypothetical protein
VDALVRAGDTAGSWAVKRIVDKRGRSLIYPLLFCGDFILRIVAVAGLTCALAVVVPAQNTAEKKPHTSTGKAVKSKASHSKSGAKASSAHPKAGAAKAHSKASSRHGTTTAKRGKKGGSKAAWRSRQLAPTPDRYKDIQSALATRGYLKQAPNGVWDTPSADALRHFQQDQNLEPSGKLNSLSLIALGLGAKRGSPVVPPGAKPVPAAITPPQAPRVQGPEPLPPSAAPPSAGANPTATEPPVPDTAQPSPAPTSPAPTSPPPPDAQPRG